MPTGNDKKSNISGLSQSPIGDKKESPTPSSNNAPSPLLSGWHSRGRLPHLKDEGATYFVTFRLGDSLPAEILQNYIAEREEIIKRARFMKRELTNPEMTRLVQLHSERIEAYLDAGYGNCWLKIPRIARMVSESLNHFDRQRYTLIAWVVMPNHVHAVLRPHEGWTLSDILHSWKSYTAHEASNIAKAGCLNIPLGETFWQRESYDHLIRDDTDFDHSVEYVIQNPVAAHLCKNPEDWPYSSVAASSL